MKKIITLALILTSIAFVSCQKKTVEPAAPTSTANAPVENAIKVQYRVSSASGHFNVEYTALEDGETKTFSKDVDKINFTYSFDWTTNKNLSIKASNITPSSKALLVEIYVNGVLFKSAEANAPGTIAIAEGVYK